MARLVRGAGKTAKPTVRKTATQVSSNITMSNELTLEDQIVSVHGPRGSGKTTLAASVSTAASKVWPPAKKAAKPVVIKDMLWLGFDAGATSCLADRGYRVGVLDYGRMKRGGMDVTKIIDTMVREVTVWAAAHPGGWIVADTITALGKELEVYWGPRTSDGFKKWAAVLETHQRFYSALRAASGRLIFLFHSKDKFAEDDKAKKKEQAKRSPGNPNIVPAISGSGGDTYLDNSSLILTMAARRETGKKTLRREVYTETTASSEAKNRFSLTLDPIEEPHLGKMWAKIEKACG